MSPSSPTSSSAVDSEHEKQRVGEEQWLELQEKVQSRSRSNRLIIVQLLVKVNPYVQKIVPLWPACCMWRRSETPLGTRHSKLVQLARIRPHEWERCPAALWGTTCHFSSFHQHRLCSSPVTIYKICLEASPPPLTENSAELLLFWQTGWDPAGKEETRVTKRLVMRVSGVRFLRAWTYKHWVIIAGCFTCACVSPGGFWTEHTSLYAQWTSGGSGCLWSSSAGSPRGSRDPQRSALHIVKVQTTAWKSLLVHQVV